MKMALEMFCNMYLTSNGFEGKRNQKSINGQYKWEYKIPSNRHSIIAYFPILVDSHNDYITLRFLLDSKKLSDINMIETQDEAIGALDAMIEILSILEDEKILPILLIPEDK